MEHIEPEIETDKNSNNFCVNIYSDEIVAMDIFFALRKMFIDDPENYELISKFTDDCIKNPITPIYFGNYFDCERIRNFLNNENIPCVIKDITRYTRKVTFEEWKNGEV